MPYNNEYPLVILPENNIPKFIRLKNLPISPKYRAKMEKSQFSENSNIISNLEVVKLPILVTPPSSPVKQNIVKF
jgi:hypothetical protein